MEDSRPRQANYMSPDCPNQPTTLPNPTPQLYTQTQKSQISPTLQKGWLFCFFQGIPSRAVAFKGNGGSNPNPNHPQTRCWITHRGSPPICPRKKSCPQKNGMPGYQGKKETNLNFLFMLLVTVPGEISLSKSVINPSCTGWKQVENKGWCC